MTAAGDLEVMQVVEPELLPAVTDAPDAVVEVGPRRFRGLDPRWCGAVVWVALGAYALSRVPDAWWRWRDDGVITLSQARGLVDFGHPAVSAAGERVEAASAPLQMFLASAYFRLGGSGWQRFMDVQVIACFALSGWSAMWLCRVHAPGQSWRRQLGAVLAAAVLGLTAWRSLGWFASGMENSLTVALLLLAMAATAATIADPDNHGWLAGAAFGLAGISRVEWAGLLLPALAATVVALRHRPKVAARVAGIAGLVWTMVHGWRHLVFGTFIPNSAVVQDKVEVDTAALWWLLGCGLLVVAMLSVWRYPRCRVTVSAVIVCIAARAWWTAWRGERYAVLGVDRLVVMSVLGLVTVVAIGWMFGVGRRSVWAVLTATAMVPIAQRLLFGKARLDAERISTMALPLLGVCAALVVLSAAEAVVRRADALGESPRRRRGGRRIGLGSLVVGVAAVGLGTSVWASSQDRPQSLCCSIDGYTTVLADAASIAGERGFAASIVATPDLGKLSFDKQVVVVDLGRLGDALLTQINRQRPDLVDEYLNQIATPDLVELHGDWACNVYRRWLATPDFRSQYRLLHADPDGAKGGCPHGGAIQYYVRGDAAYDAEAALAADLSSAPTTAPAAVRAAYVDCRGERPSVDCAAVRRAISRSVPALRAAGTFDAVVAATDASPTPELDRLMFATPPGWAPRAAELLIPLLGSPDEPLSG